MAPRSRGFAVLSSVLLVGAACTLSAPSLDGKACPCVGEEGFRCDELTGRCVRGALDDTADRDGGDGSGGTPEGGLPGTADAATDSSGSTAFCASHPSAAFCEDFEDGFDPRWDSLPTGRYLSLVQVGEKHGTAARIALDAPHWIDGGGPSEDNALRVAGTADGTYVLSFALQVLKVAPQQIIDLASLNTQASPYVAMQFTLKGTSVGLVEFIPSQSSYVRTELGAVTLGMWHRLEIEVTFGPPNMVAGRFDSTQSFASRAWAKAAQTDLGGNLRMTGGLHYITDYNGPSEYFVDDFLLERK